jgi:Tetratricopeptide repeat
MSEGQFEEAVEINNEVLGIRSRILGSETLQSKSNLAQTYRYQKRFQDAARVQEEVLTASLKTLGEKHPDTLLHMKGYSAISDDLIVRSHFMNCLSIAQKNSGGISH